MVALSLPPHSSTTCLYYCGLLGICFILWVLRQYYYVIWLLQFALALAFQLPLVDLCHHLNVCCLYLGIVLFVLLCFEHFLSF